MSAKMTEEQKKIFEKSGAKNDWVVGLVFFFIFLAVVGFSIFSRYNDNRKLEKLEYTQGSVIAADDTREWIGRRSHIRNSITVEYTPEGSERSYRFIDSDGPYEFNYKGQILGVYYHKDDPEKAYIAKKDWLTHKDVRADRFYEGALIISGFPFFISLFFFVEELTVRKNIKKGTFILR